MAEEACQELSSNLAAAHARLSSTVAVGPIAFGLARILTKLSARHPRLAKLAKKSLAQTRLVRLHEGHPSTAVEAKMHFERRSVSAV